MARYRRNGKQVVIEAAVRNSRQLYNERDPSPFRERDLDINFASYITSSVQEFPLKTPMIIKLLIMEESDRVVDMNAIRNSIKNYFQYESEFVQAKLNKRMRVSRFFLLIGFFVLIICFSISHVISSLEKSIPFITVAKEGFLIVGWVAMWRPVEGVLYDWWPLREERRYLQKIASMEVKICCKV